MKRAKVKQAYKIIYIILCVSAWVFLYWRLNALNETKIVDDIWGSHLDFVMGSFVSLIVLLTQFGLYYSTVYLFFEVKKRLWKVILHVGILICAISIIVALLIIIIPLI